MRWRSVDLVSRPNPQRVYIRLPVEPHDQAGNFYLTGQTTLATFQRGSRQNRRDFKGVPFWGLFQ
jgi:hypothetical protein